MARTIRRPRPTPPKSTAVQETPPPVLDPIPEPPRASWRVLLAVVVLLATQAGLAVDSLLRENATVDEVAHLPAGVSYWEQGTFKLYHHNPPLVKLVAALPVVLSPHDTSLLYQMGFWRQESHATFAEYFAYFNAANYFELFDRARLPMPLFAMIGGLVVFLWSSRLFGPGGGLLSLALWVFCPNILAHGRLITTDVAATSLGVAATYLFWRYQRRPTWTRACLAGLVLGLAELTKFSLLLLYAFWPALAVARFLLEREFSGWPRRLVKGLAQWLAMVAISVVVIDAGYAFEGVGQPLGRFEFVSKALTGPVPPGMTRPSSWNPLLEQGWRYRVNRFRGTILEQLPVPLPRHYVLGFDEQKIETEGIPRYFFDEKEPHDDAQLTGYSVYLDGQMKRSGWWYYYLATLAYKVPEGTWILVLLGGFALFVSKRARVPWADEVSVLALPVGVLGAMSFLTDICLGLRYILPIFPYIYISTGRVVPWLAGLEGGRKRLASGVVGLALGGTVLSALSIHPHYLAYFNQVSGGPDRGAEHLIDSNLDWGQDLVTLKRWLKANAPGRKVGLAYFGQINPSIFMVRGEGFEWFLPPVLPDTTRSMLNDPSRPLAQAGPAPRLTPGLYAVSASIVRGLPWRLHDSLSLRPPYVPWSASWNAGLDAFGYFREISPIARVGHSIYVYEVTPDDCARLARGWSRPRVELKGRTGKDGQGPG